MREDNATGLAETINSALTPVSDAVNSVIFYSVYIGETRLPLVVVWLIAAALIFTAYFRFLNVRGIAHAVSIVRGAAARKDHDGEITHFQALTAALSGTVGLGNIASVPVAIAIGGPGAAFWMVVAGFFGMTTKFAECAMAVKYRRVNPDGSVSGGPMYYIEAAFARLGAARLGKILAAFFAVMTMGASISLFQVNQAHAQFSVATGVSAPVVFGVVMAFLVGLVIIGGIKNIARVTSRLTPFMCLLYLAAGVVILAMHFGEIPGAVSVIVKSAFGVDAAAGGMIGALINGVQRATYSSEAGVGSAAIAHAAVRTNEPVTEGYVGLLEPFIDTVIVAAMTALLIVVTGAYLADLPPGIAMTSAAFDSAFSWFPAVLSVAAVLFAFSTLVTWSYYGLKGATYLFGEGQAVQLTFKVVLCLILSTGAAVQLSAILDFTDSMLFAMAAPNLIALYILLPELRRDLLAYNKKYNQATCT